MQPVRCSHVDGTAPRCSPHAPPAGLLSSQSENEMPRTPTRPIVSNHIVSASFKFSLYTYSTPLLVPTLWLALKIAQNGTESIKWFTITTIQTHRTKRVEAHNTDGDNQIFMSILQIHVSICIWRGDRRAQEDITPLVNIISPIEL